MNKFLDATNYPVHMSNLIGSIRDAVVVSAPRQ